MMPVEFEEDSTNPQRKFPDDPRLSQANFQELIEELFSRDLSPEQAKHIEDKANPFSKWED